MTQATHLQIPRSLKDAATPERCALIVYDTQARILSQLPHGAEVLGKVLQVLEISRAHGFRTFFIRHMSLPKKLAGVFQMRQAMAWQRVDSPQAVNPWFLRGSPGLELAPLAQARA